MADFVKFNFRPNHLRGAKAKLGLKFGDNRTNGLEVIDFFMCFFSKWRPSWISNFKILTIFSYCGCRVDDFCQSWSKSDKPFWHYYIIYKFQSDIGGHLGFCSYCARRHYLPDQYGITFISANFHISITMCSIFIGKVPLNDALPWR